MDAGDGRARVSQRRGENVSPVAASAVICWWNPRFGRFAGSLYLRAGTAQCATSDDRGEFRAGERRPPAQSVTVIESVFVAPDEIKVSNYLGQARERGKSAGALQDVSRYVQTLPGFASGVQ